MFILVKAVQFIASGQKLQIQQHNGDKMQEHKTNNQAYINIYIVRCGEGIASV